MEYLQKKIDDFYEPELSEKLSELSLLETYKNMPSVKIRIEKLVNILKKYDIEEEKVNKIILDYTSDIIPPGTKGIVKGNKFNEIVKEKIESFCLIRNDDFIIEFESQSPTYHSEERPDWYILQKSTNKQIIGMNQLDMWSGGQQLNRGSKYVLDENRHLEPKVKNLNVVCNYYRIKSEKNKIYKLFSVGLERKRMCYPSQLEEIIYEFFGL